MRIYQNLIEAVREVERDLFEMGIDVHPQTMQDKYVANDTDYMTKEIRGYSFKVVNWTPSQAEEEKVVSYFFKEPTLGNVLAYINVEFLDRVSGPPLNPGNSYQYRKDVWNEFIHGGKFSYTYSERMSPQVGRILTELDTHPESRQAIINLHSNICPISEQNVIPSKDLQNTGGFGRIPCSMYYQIMIREGKVDLIYTMRSCDFLTHFPVDILLALRLQSWFAKELQKSMGTFTYFVGSLHAYQKDLKVRGIF